VSPVLCPSVLDLIICSDRRNSSNHPFLAERISRRAEQTITMHEERRK